MLNRIELKRAAKGITRSARISAYGFTLVYLLLTAFLGLVNSYVNAADDRVLYIGNITLSLNEYFFFSHPAFPGAVVLFVGVLVWLLQQVLSAGWVLYHQGVRRGRYMPMSSLFDGFAFTGKIILLSLVTVLFVALWSMLLIIPGIVAVYRYRFALYNLCENPEIGVMDALRLSKQQTYGFKLDLFMLDLSFLGWSILCSLTLGILSIWINPYIQQTDLAYFDAIRSAKSTGGFEPNDPPEDNTFRPDDRF